MAQTSIELPTITAKLLDAVERSEDSKLKALSRDELVGVVERYRRFLFLVKRYPDEPLAPTMDIDEVWHLHMLQPVAYYDDCMAWFGYILDHNGGFGAKEGEWEILLSYFDRTAQLWLETFGEPYLRDESGPVRCTRACKVITNCRTRCHKPT